MSDGYGFLLLSSHLGNPDRLPLTTSQLRKLTQRVIADGMQKSDGELDEHDLLRLGYDRKTAGRIAALLSESELLANYLRLAKVRRCVPVTRQNPAYPVIVRKRLGLDSPGCLWMKGDMEILNQPAVSLIGSRKLLPENRFFAEEVGRQAARQGLVLVSGNAKGADHAAQEACLKSGGKVISVVADALHSQIERDNVLFVSEDDYDAPFSAQRALHRNRVIHSLGWITIAAQCSLHTGGTWNGAVQNLKMGWSKFFCFRDGSDASMELEQMGAHLIDLDALADFAMLAEPEPSLFDA